jgi:glutathione synthase/RimK-type ligase-like ATP-grasp enzyme
MAEQWQAFIEALESVPGPKWLSAPSAIRRAEDKALQLAEAQKVGLRVPATLITNSLSEARSFVAARRVAVSKSVTAAFWEHGENASFVYAQRVVAAELPDAQEAFGTAPIVLQELIEPKRDVRVTVVGERVLAAILEPTSVVDWRLEPERVWRPYELPDRLERKCVALVRRLGLRFSGIDLLRDDQERLWFLEANPNGEWGWLERRAGLRIAEAIVEELLS